MLDLLGGITLDALAIFILLFLGSITENCATYAIRKWITQGGTIAIRESLFADDIVAPQNRGLGYRIAKLVPHFVWVSPEGRVWQYTVKHEWKEKWKGKSLLGAWINLWFYDGIEKNYDPYLGEVFHVRQREKPKGVWMLLTRTTNEVRNEI